MLNLLQQNLLYLSTMRLWCICGATALELLLLYCSATEASNLCASLRPSPRMDRPSWSCSETQSPADNKLQDDRPAARLLHLRPANFSCLRKVHKRLRLQVLSASNAARHQGKKLQWLARRALIGLVHCMNCRSAERAPPRRASRCEASKLPQKVLASPQHRSKSLNMIMTKTFFITG